MIYLILIGVAGMLFAAYSHAIKKQGREEALHEDAEKEKDAISHEAGIDARLVTDDDVINLLRRKADKARKHESIGK